VLAHSYAGMVFRDIRLNGVSVSEGYLNAALAGEFGRPVLLVSGDSETAADAQRYAPEAVACIVKEAFGFRAAAAVTPAESAQMIAAAARDALARPRPRPFLPAGPYVLEVDVVMRVTAEMLGWLPGLELTAPYTVRGQFGSIADVMRFLSFATFYSPSGIIKL
jgi:D-amino peptidase